MRLKHLLPVALTLLLSSCATQKQIAYFQDIPQRQTYVPLTADSEIKIRPKDKISIIVNCQDARLTNLFNLPVISQQIGSENSNYNVPRGLSGYTVDADGNIDFPVIGLLNVQGMTRDEISWLVKAELTNRDLVKDPVVTVEFLNLTVDVMGEVTRPGRYSIDKDYFTLFDALSLAGDLSIFGKRDRILLMRDVNGQKCVYHVDLRSAKDVYASPAYFLQQNDIIYVEPNSTKARQSTVNGNSVRSTSTWISIASLLTTIAVMFIKK